MLLGGEPLERTRVVESGDALDDDLVRADLFASARSRSRGLRGGVFDLYVNAVASTFMVLMFSRCETRREDVKSARGSVVA